MTVYCGGYSPIHERRRGNLVIRDSCGINIPDSLRVFPSHTEHVTQQLNIREDFNIILPQFSTSHLQDSVIPIDEPEMLKDNKDYWWDLDTYPEVYSIVVLPTMLILTVVTLGVAVRWWHVKKAKKVVQTVDLVCKKVSNKPSPAGRTSVNNPLPQAESVV